MVKFLLTPSVNTVLVVLYVVQDTCSTVELPYTGCFIVVDVNSTLSRSLWLSRVVYHFLITCTRKGFSCDVI